MNPASQDMIRPSIPAVPGGSPSPGDVPRPAPFQAARILGFVRLAGLDALRAALSAVPGPPIHACHGPGIAALLQPEPDERLARDDPSALLTVQRRLQAACKAGPFLPTDPSAATCPATDLQSMLEPLWQALDQALRLHGARHQWDIVLSWSPDPILARQRTRLEAIAGGTERAKAIEAVLLAERARREAALLNTLAPMVRAFAAGERTGSQTEAAVTILLDAGGEPQVEAALGPLSRDARLDMRGPLPPLDFAAVRIETVEADDISRAWRRLDLPERVNLAGLQQHWRRQTAMAHPGGRGPAPDRRLTAAQMSDAYRKLRPLLLRGGGGAQTLLGLLRHAGRCLTVPETARIAAPGLDLVS